MKPSKYGAQPAKNMLRGRGLSVAATAVTLGVPHPHLQACLSGAIRPNDIVRKKLPQLLNTSLSELFTAEVLQEASGSGRGGISTVEVCVYREGEEFDSHDAVATVKTFTRPPVCGESLTYSDGEWIVANSWYEDGRFFIKLRRPRDFERTWPKGTWPE